MAIPDYQTILLPLLKLLGDQKKHRIREVVKALANKFNLSEDDRCY